MFDKQDIHELAQLHPSSTRLRFRVKTYLLRTLLILGTLIQWFLLWKLWIGKPLPEILGEINGLAPPYGAKPTLFQKEPNFNPLNSSDPRWTSLLPKLGGGFVQIPHGKSTPSSRLQSAHQATAGRASTWPVFHQLHCLHSIAGLVEELLALPGEATIRSSRRKHIEHCFEYLRLSLRCCGDTTLEGQGKTVELPGIDGFGSWHIVS